MILASRHLSKRPTSPESGMVAMITTIIVSILLVIIVTSMTSLMIGELRQASDGDQSIRAYYAAEAGVEDALLKIKKDIAAGIALSGGGACVSSGAALGSVEYTCQRIIYDTNTVEGRLAKEQSLQIDLSTAAPSPVVQSVKVSWNQDGIDAPVPFTPIANFPEGNNWGNRPAVMELSLASYPDNPNFSLGQIDYQTTVLKPSNAGAGMSFSNISNSGPISVNCAPARPYTCQAVVSGLSPTRRYVLRLRPRYAGTRYQVQAFTCPNAACGPSTVADQFATVDVTARAGDVFRRVVVKMPVRAGAYNVDYVLWSDTDICKNFKVRESLNQAQADIGCGVNTFD
jgi:Tfp pilus assembly protein PilX